jgi:hypothetical protein
MTTLMRCSGNFCYVRELGSLTSQNITYELQLHKVNIELRQLSQQLPWSYSVDRDYRPLCSRTLRQPRSGAKVQFCGKHTSFESQVVNIWNAKHSTADI